MGWIGIAGGNAVNVKREKKEPYTPEQYDKVLTFFRENQGSFFTIAKVDSLAGIKDEAATEAIITAQVADPRTGVTTNPKSEDEYGIPKKEEKKGKK